MSKLKFYKKWKEDQAYSPAHEWGEDEPSIEVENLTIDEPSSPLSSYSLTFDGANWVIPIDENDMKEENFIPPRTSSPIEGKISY